MNRSNRITIHAPLNKVFLAAADLTRWPEFLPHYRHNRFLSQTPSGGVVKMSCVHAGLRWSWTSRFEIDPERHELRFTHLRSPLGVSRGTEVIWKIQENADGGVDVIITHELAVAWPFAGRFVADKILAAPLAWRLAEKTLSGLKRKVEAQQHPERSAAGAQMPSRPKRKAAGQVTKKPRKARARSESAPKKRRGS